MSTSYVHLWYIRPLTDRLLVHLDLGVPSQYRVPKWLSTPWSLLHTNIHHGQPQMSRYSTKHNECFKLTHNNRGSKREDTGNYSPSKLENFTRPRRSLQCHIHRSSLYFLSSVSNSSANPIAIATSSVPLHTVLFLWTLAY